MYNRYPAWESTRLERRPRLPGPPQDDNVFTEVALIGGAGYELGVVGPRSASRAKRDALVLPGAGRAAIARAHVHEEEAVLGKEKVAVLTEGLWKDLFARDRMWPAKIYG